MLVCYACAYAFRCDTCVKGVVIGRSDLRRRLGVLCDSSLLWDLLITKGIDIT